MKGRSCSNCGSRLGAAHSRSKACRRTDGGPIGFKMQLSPQRGAHSTSKSPTAAEIQLAFKMRLSP
eukprot:7623505-Pyramimonas_sp.AAC.2